MTILKAAVLSFALAFVGAPAAPADSLACAQQKLPAGFRTAIAEGYATKGMDGVPELDEAHMEPMLECVNMEADNAPEQAGFLFVALQSTEVIKAAEKALAAHAVTGAALDSGWRQLSAADRTRLSFDTSQSGESDPTDVIMKLLPMVKPGASPENADEKLVEHLTAYAMFRGMLESLAGRY